MISSLALRSEIQRFQVPPQWLIIIVHKSPYLSNCPVQANEKRKVALTRFVSSVPVGLANEIYLRPGSSDSSPSLTCATQNRSMRTGGNNPKGYVRKRAYSQRLTNGRGVA